MKKETIIKQCPACGSINIKRVTEMEQKVIDGHLTIIYPHRYWKCIDCQSTGDFFNVADKFIETILNAWDKYNEEVTC